MSKPTQFTIIVNNSDTASQFDSPEQIANYFSTFGKQLGLQILYAVVFLIIGLLLVKLLIFSLRKIWQKKKFNETTTYFALSALNVAMKLLVFMISINILGINLGSIANVFAAIAFAIGIAMSGLLQNFMAGAYLVASRPIAVGEYVKVVGDVEGIVKEIGVINTIIQTADLRHVIVPNSNLSASNITNFDKEPIRRCDREVLIPFNEDLEYIVEILLRACRKNNLILKNPKAEVKISNSVIDPKSNLTLSIRAYVKKSDYWQLWFELSEMIKITFDKYQITSYNTDDDMKKIIRRPLTPELEVDNLETDSDNEEQSLLGHIKWRQFFSKRIGKKDSSESKKIDDNAGSDETTSLNV